MNCHLVSVSGANSSEGFVAVSALMGLLLEVNRLFMCLSVTSKPESLGTKPAFEGFLFQVNSCLVINLGMDLAKFFVAKLTFVRFLGDADYILLLNMWLRYCLLMNLAFF